MGFRGLLLVAGGLLAATAGAEPPKETIRAKALAQMDGKWTLGKGKGTQLFSLKRAASPFCPRPLSVHVYFLSTLFCPAEELGIDAGA